MKKLFLILSVAMICVSCGKKNAVIKIEIKGADSKEILFSQLKVDKIEVIDTMKTDKSGKASFKFEIADKSPNYYYLSYNRKRVASLILKPGDRVTVVADTLGNGLEIRGSEESLLLGKLDKEFSNSVNQFDSLTTVLTDYLQSGEKENAEKIRYALGALYVKQKRSSIKSIMEHPYSFTNISLLYQQFTNMLPVFADANDVLIFQRVHDSLKPLYPQSAYIRVLENEISQFSNSQVFTDRLATAPETAFPNMVLPDMNSKQCSLNSLLGRPFILLFWTSENLDQKVFNLDLLEVYNKYHKSGLEVYSVCIGTDKSQWASTVREQKLPWINVCDGLGLNSPAIATYNLSKLPTMILFDKEGNIKGKDLFMKAKLEADLSSIVK